MAVMTAKEAQDMTLEARERMRRESQETADIAIMKFINPDILTAINRGVNSCEIHLPDKSVGKDPVGRYVWWIEGKGKKKVQKKVYLLDIHTRLEELGYMSSYDYTWAPRMFMISWKGEQDANS
jgi:hypothetical protein